MVNGLPESRRDGTGVSASLREPKRNDQQIGGINYESLRSSPCYTSTVPDRRFCQSSSVHGRGKFGSDAEARTRPEGSVESRLRMHCYPFGYQGPALSAPPPNRSEAHFSNAVEPMSWCGRTSGSSYPNRTSGEIIDLSLGFHQNGHRRGAACSPVPGVVEAALRRAIRWALIDYPNAT